MRRFNTKKFIKDVLNDKYALVVGNEVILDSKIEPTHDVHQYILRKVNDNSNLQYENYHEIALDKNERINPIRKLIEDGDILFSADHLDGDLMNLLSSKIFATVLTTTTDGFLEAAMKKIWGKDLRVVNIYDKETVDDFQKALRNCRRGNKYTQPTLIYVFGKLDTDDLAKRYIKTDADAVLLIEKWMRMDVEANNEMLEFIKSKRLLALGCKFENWYFRFFWYVLTGVNRSSEENNYDGMGEVAFSLNKEDQADGRLIQFLDRTDICILGNAKSFIENINKTLTEDSGDATFRKQVMECRRRGGVFISYSSKDALAASKLFFQLSEKKFDVWLDNTRLYGGDDYETEISDAIGTAKVVITLLSPHVANDLKEGKTDNYYNKEWRMSQQFKDKIIIPVAVNGYDLRSDYHAEYEKIAISHISGIDLMFKDGFSKLTSSINEHL